MTRSGCHWIWITWEGIWKRQSLIQDSQLQAQPPRNKMRQRPYWEEGKSTLEAATEKDLNSWWLVKWMWLSNSTLWSTNVILGYIKWGDFEKIRAVSSGPVIYVTSNTKSKLSLLYRHKNPNELREILTWNEYSLGPLIFWTLILKAYSPICRPFKLTLVFQSNDTTCASLEAGSYLQQPFHTLEITYKLQGHHKRP